MRKVVPLSLGLIFLLAATAPGPAQTSPADTAVNEAVLRQANAIILRQKLQDAKNTATRGDLPGAAKLYEDAYTLVEQIGSGIDAEKTQTISGLVSTRLTLARQAQSQGDLREAATQVSRVLKVDPQNSAALAFKKDNDRLLASMRGKMPDEQTMQEVPEISKDKTQASTWVRDGKLLYEMGKFDEAEVKLKEAIRLDPDNTGAFYYMNLVKQARYDRETHMHTIDTQEHMVQVENAWVKPINLGLLPTSNPYALTNLVHTGEGREVIYGKLNHIRLDKVSWPEGLPLSEVLRNLSDQTKLRDPDKKGINFIFNPNAAAASAATAPVGGATTINPNNGLPETAPVGAAGGESVDASSINVKLTLADVRLADVLDAIVLVADHPIKYSVLDYGIVFSAKGPESPQLETRTFKIDPNTFMQGLESVGAQSFGSASSSGGGGGSSGGGGGGGGSSGNQNSGASVAVVNAFPGAGQYRSSGQGGGGGGGGGGGRGGGGGGGQGGGGLSFVTTTNFTANVSLAAQGFFTTLGVNLAPPKSVFFNDRLGVLFVRATSQDLDTIEKAIQVLNMTPPQVHIKARFIEVGQDDTKALGFDWYLGQVNMGKVVGSGGSSPSLNVPVSAANPLGAFPGNTSASLIPGSAGDQLITGGLQNSGPALATLTGILTDPNFRVVIHALEQRSGTETLAEPEVTTISGRQTQMRATQILTIITSFNFQQSSSGITTTTSGGTTTP
jgi:tetratricopeptide (TPR) repeat protein